MERGFGHKNKVGFVRNIQPSGSKSLRFWSKLLNVEHSIIYVHFFNFRKAAGQSQAIVYSRNSNPPALERIPFKDLQYNSTVFLNSSDPPSADNTQTFYEYCTVSNSQDELETFTPNEYEISNEERVPPALPDRPDSLAPIPHRTFPDDTSRLPNSPRSESTYSGQPLLTPNISFSGPEDYGHDNHHAETLPKRSIDGGESTLTRLLKKAKKWWVMCIKRIRHSHSSEAINLTPILFPYFLDWNRHPSFIVCHYLMITMINLYFCQP